MAFPPAVAEKALLDSGRHCCLCHAFCGFNIELHHVVQRADGGADTYDNCIPLCLNCHAEIKAYDPHHPIGRRYTKSELRAHRDKWYAKVAASGGVAINPSLAEPDRELFREIQALLPSTGSIEFLRHHDYASAFPIDSHRDLREFYHQRERPEFEFIDADLEGLRAELISHASDFLLAITSYAFFSKTRTSPQFAEVPREWSYDKPEEFKEAVDKLNGAAERFCETYDRLIRLGRRKLAMS